MFKWQSRETQSQWFLTALDKASRPLAWKHKLMAKVEIMPPSPSSILMLIWPTLGCKIYLIIPQWSRIWSDSKILDCNCCFCEDYTCIICYLHQRVVFYQNSHGTTWKLPVCKHIQNMDWNGEPIWQQTWMKWWKLHCVEVPTLQHVEI